MNALPARYRPRKQTSAECFWRFVALELEKVRLAVVNPINELIIWRELDAAYTRSRWTDMRSCPSGCWVVAGLLQHPLVLTRPALDAIEEWLAERLFLAMEMDLAERLNLIRRFLAIAPWAAVPLAQRIADGLLGLAEEDLTCWFIRTGTDSPDWSRRRYHSSADLDVLFLRRASGHFLFFCSTLFQHIEEKLPAFAAEMPRLRAQHERQLALERACLRKTLLHPQPFVRMAAEDLAGLILSFV